MNFNKLAQLASQAVQVVEGSEQFPVGILAVQAQKLAEVFPHDLTVRGMESFLKKRAENQSFITRSELRSVYDKLYSRGNKFAKHFESELGLAQETIKTASAREVKTDILVEAFETTGNGALKNSLSSILDNKSVVKFCSDRSIKSAEKSCLHELNMLGVPPKMVEVVAGQEDLVICRAAYETPRGTTNVLIPIELKNEKALLPTMFLSEAGFLDLEKQKLEDHLLKTAGLALRVDAGQILNLLDKIKNGETKVVGEVEEIVLRASLKRGAAAHGDNGVVYMPLEEVKEEREVVVVEGPEEYKNLGDRLNTAAGTAELLLGKNTVDMGRSLVAQTLTDCGFKNAQVRVASSNKNTVTYAVAIQDGLGFKVPVKIANNKLVAPSFGLTENGLIELSSESIKAALVTKVANRSAALQASALYDLNPRELYVNLEKALAEENYLRAEDALALLEKSGDELAYRKAFDVYTSHLRGDKLQKTASVSCSRQYKVASTGSAMCGHYHLPVEKVFQDENGKCKPLYRKGEEISTPALLTNYKMFW